MPHAHRPADNIEPGATFTRLRVEEFVAMTLKRRRLWRCVCVCGNEILVNGTDLVCKETQSCGCLRNDQARKNREKHRKDLTGTQLRHGGVVLGPSDQYIVRRSGDRYNLWRCKCACGAEFLAQAPHIVHRNRSFCSRKCPFVKKKEVAAGIDYAGIRATLARPGGYRYVSLADKTEITLAAAKGDKRAAELLVLLYDRWVLQRATTYARTHRIKGELVIEELVQEGRLALFKAAQHWEPERGAFTTCAAWWLLNAMEREENSGTSGVRVPVNAHNGKRTREDAINAHKMMSLDEPIRANAEDDQRLLRDVLEDVVDEPMFSNEELESIPLLLECLTPKDRAVVERYFLGEKTLEEVGQERGVTRERIRQIVDAAVAKMRREAKRKGLTD